MARENCGVRNQNSGLVFDEFEAVAPGILRVEAASARECFIVDRIESASAQNFAECIQVGYSECGMRFSCWQKIALDADVNLLVSAPEPAAATGAQYGRFHQLRHPQNAAVEFPRGGFASVWSGDLDVVDANDLALHLASVTCVTRADNELTSPAGAKYARLKTMDLFEEIVRMRRAGERGALATIVHTNGSIPSYESSRMLVREDGSMAGTIGGGCVEAEVWAAAKDVIRVEQPRKMTFNLNQDAAYDSGLICGGTLEIFVEPILPQPVLFIFGGGHISSAVARAASAAGFGIGIADDREAFANVERFPMANQIYSTYEDAFDKLKPNASTYLLIVTRGHKDDMRVLAWAVRTEARYIGMIGSKRKVISVYQALEKEGYAPEEFERVHAPVGLDIGALAPEEIAVSIAAELIAVRRNAQNLQHKSVKLSQAVNLHHD
jgi:xanthine dehydrogenase accessory factor